MNERLLDIHTHSDKGNPGEAIISRMPGELVIEPGKWYSVGIHPWELSGSFAGDGIDLLQKASHGQVLAIGETGYDRLKDFDHDLQKKSFEFHVDIAEHVKKPVIIHSVRTTDILLSEIKRLKPKTTWIIHGYRGKKEEATQLINAGFYLSFGEKYNVDALRNTPLDRLFLETDESKLDIHHIYNKVAKDLHLDVAELEERVDNNIQRIFFQR